MKIRGTVLAAGLVLGLGAGYVAARALPPDPVVVSAQAPLPAVPSFPGADPGVLPDPDLPVLAGDTDLTEAVLGKGDRRTAVPVPSGWQQIDLRPGEARWILPENPPGSYSVRVRVLPGDTSLSRMVDDRRVALRGDPTISQLRLRPEEESTAALAATFVKSGYRKVTLIRWINFHGTAQANLEIAWTGRFSDEDGMRTLLSRMAGDARPAPGDPES